MVRIPYTRALARLSQHARRMVTRSARHQTKPILTHGRAIRRVVAVWVTLALVIGAQPRVALVAAAEPPSETRVIAAPFATWGQTAARMPIGGLKKLSLSETGGTADDSSFVGTRAISADGRYVAFVSGATNLVSGDTNAQVDVFVRDAVLDTTERVSVRTDGTQFESIDWDVAISGDGRYVAFIGRDSLLAVVQVYVRDRVLGTTQTVSKNA